MNKKILSGSICLLGIILASPLTFASDTTPTSQKHKAGYDNEEGFAGPGATVYQLEHDDEDKISVLGFPAIDNALKPWFDLKKGLDENYGFQLGVAYTTTYQTTNDEIAGAESEAWSGILRVAGKWELVNRGSANKGSIVFSADNRANYTDASPGNFSGNIGYIGQTGTLFSDVDTVLVDLFWQQYIGEQTGFIAGRFDPSDFVHVLGHKSPWDNFQNLNTLLDSSVAYPDAGIGAGFGHWFDKSETGQFYLLAGFNDANGKVVEEQAFDNGAEFFKFAEFGWSPSKDERYTTNLHLSVWQVDERIDEGLDNAAGYAIGGNYTFEQLTLFGQAGFSSANEANDPQIYEASYTVGGTYNIKGRSDQLGFALNYGELASSDNEQTTGELYYRIQATENLAFTPSIQCLQNPALNTEDDVVTIYGLRARITL